MKQLERKGLRWFLDLRVHLLFYQAKESNSFIFQREAIASQGLQRLWTFLNVNI